MVLSVLRRTLQLETANCFTPLKKVIQNHEPFFQLLNRERLRSPSTLRGFLRRSKTSPCSMSTQTTWTYFSSKPRTMSGIETRILTKRLQIIVLRFLTESNEVKSGGLIKTWFLTWNPSLSSAISHHVFSKGKQESTAPGHCLLESIRVAACRDKG